MSGSGSQHKSHHGHRKPGSGRHGHRQPPEQYPNHQPPVPRPLALPRQPPPQTPSFSFLFVVNTLELDDVCERDVWGVIEPPMTRAGYQNETPSMVFRFRDGLVTPVPVDQNYSWFRSYPGVEGGIVSGARWSQIPGSNSYEPNYFTPHATYTIFRGWKFRPIVFMESDASVHDVNTVEWNRMFHVLGFEQRLGNAGNISVARPRGKLYAVGRDADWVGKLVPNSYKHPLPHAVRSGGLGGPLALVLGLMALSQRAGHELKPFLDRYWRSDGTWHGPRWEFESCEPGPNSAPRGVIVHVCCDEDENMLGSTIESIRMTEDTSVIVNERS